MHVLDLLRLVPDFLYAEASFVWSEDSLCGTNVCNVERIVIEQIDTYDLLEILHRRTADDALKFPS